MKREKIITLFEIFLFISLTFAVAYIIRENNSSLVQTTIKKTQSFNILSFYTKIIGIVFKAGSLVSALDESDLNKGAWTCKLNKEGAYCQEYPASECDAKCTTGC